MAGVNKEIHLDGQDRCALELKGLGELKDGEMRFPNLSVDGPTGFTLIVVNG